MLMEFTPNRIASLRGMPFHFDTANESGGHRKIDHEYPNRDAHEIENLGLSADRFNVSGYLSDIDPRAEKIRTLRNVLKASGAASFYHPLLDEVFSVEITEWNIDSTTNAIGRINFTFTAIKVLDNWSVSPISLVSGEATLIGNAETLITALQSQLDTVYYLPTFTNDINAVWDVIDTRQSLSFEPQRNLYRQSLSDSRRYVTSDTAASRIFSLSESLYEDTVLSSRAYFLFEWLSLNGIQSINGVSGASKKQNAQRRALSNTLSIAAFQSLAKVVINHDYQDKNTAHELRFKFAQTGLRLQQRYGTTNDSELHNAVSEIIAVVGQAYQSFTDQLKPVAYLRNANQTSLSLAWDIYQNPDMADDLIARNEVINGSFMPAVVEYLTP